MAWSKYYSKSGIERVGFILTSGEEVEVENIHEDPNNGFDVDPAILVKYEADIVATFHTHPDCSSNLSVDDYQAFFNWPEVLHFIIGNDGIRCFQVKQGKIKNADPNLHLWGSEEPLS
jgi:proteasome lid subunit RPN8/RPN11